MSKTRKIKRGGKKSSNSGESVKTPILSSSSKSKSISSTNKYSHANLVIMFLRMLNTVKLYHWKTTSHSQHKATDELYTNLNASIDSFVEIMLGKDGSRVNLTSVKSIPLHDYTNLSDFKQEVDMYKEYLINLQVNTKKDTDLLNIRDEILGHLNQFTYLLTFK
jgi:DNA-binding ferritin-like protein